MIRQSRQNLTLAELLVVLALVAVALAIARRWWDAWEAEEWTLAIGWLAAWIVGVVGGRILIGRVVLPAAALCVVTATAIAVYQKVPLQAVAIVIAPALLLAAAAAPLARCTIVATAAAWNWCRRARPVVQRIAMGAVVVLALSVVAAAAAHRFDRPAVTVDVLTRQPRGPACISPQARLWALRSDQGIEVFDSQSRTTKPLPDSNDLEARFFSHDGRWLACVKRNEKMYVESIHVFDVVNGNVARFPWSATPFPWALSFPTSGQLTLGPYPDADDESRIDLLALEPEPVVLRSMRVARLESPQELPRMKQSEHPNAIHCAVRCERWLAKETIWGLPPEITWHVPFWRLRCKGNYEIWLEVTDSSCPGRLWSSSRHRVQLLGDWGTPIMSPCYAPDQSAVSVRDQTGKLILWRIHRSPFAEE